MQALVISIDSSLVRDIPRILSVAGFCVDVLCLKNAVLPSRYIRAIHEVSTKGQIAEKASSLCPKQYDLVVNGDDETLGLILKSQIPDGDKLILLPVTQESFFDHIYSKIGLAKRLHYGKVCSPKFQVADSATSAQQLAQDLGLPVVLKVDSSGGGGGVFICQSLAELSAALTKISNYPILIQEYICGPLIDLSGFYQEGKLIYFTYSVFEKTVGGPLGPSSLRTYTQLGALDDTIFCELTRLGEVLGIHGFANISCIQSSQDDRRYYIEADLRPTVWVDFGRYLGQDLANSIKQYFLFGRPLSWPIPLNSDLPKTKVIPFIHRLGLIDLLLNRYQAWLYLQELSNREKMYLFVGRPIQSAERWAVVLIKPVLPKFLWQSMTDTYRTFKNCLRTKLMTSNSEGGNKPKINSLVSK